MDKHVFHYSPGSSSARKTDFPEDWERQIATRQYIPPGPHLTKIHNPDKEGIWSGE